MADCSHGEAQSPRLLADVLPDTVEEDQCQQRLAAPAAEGPAQMTEPHPAESPAPMAEPHPAEPAERPAPMAEPQPAEPTERPVDQSLHPAVLAESLVKDVHTNCGAEDAQPNPPGPSLMEALTAGGLMDEVLAEVVLADDPYTLLDDDCCSESGLSVSQMEPLEEGGVTVNLAGSDAAKMLGDRLGSMEAATEILKQIHSQHTNQFNSYNKKKEWEQFKRQARSSAHPIEQCHIARFAVDRQSLFQDWMEGNKSWGAVKVLEIRRQKSKRKAQKAFKMMSRSDLMRRYDNDEELVAEIIKGKLDNKMFTPNPDCPHRNDQYIYFCIDEITAIDSHSMQIEQQLELEASPDEGSVKSLMGSEGMFGDRATPLRSGLPSAAWGVVMSDLQPGVTPATALPSSPPEAAASQHELIDLLRGAIAAPAGGVSVGGKAEHNALNFARILAAAPQPPPKRQRNGDNGQTSPATATKSPGGPAKAKGKAKAKSKPAQSALTRGKALRTCCLDEASKCIDTKDSLHDVDGCDSLQTQLESHAKSYDGIFNECNDLIKDKANGEKEELWDPIFKKAETLKANVKESISIAGDCLKGIARRAKATNAK